MNEEDVVNETTEQARSMAYVVTIDDIQPIENADNIEVALVGGWKVVVRKGEFKPGEFACYFEIDSWIPEIIAPFLVQQTPIPEYNGVPGNRLRTKKLRGVVSQGLLLPLNEIVEIHTKNLFSFPLPKKMFEGDDLTEALNIQKWERVFPATMGGSSRGNFPSFIPKTDQERVQNIKRDWEYWMESGVEFEVTEKLDGTSCTIYRRGDDFGVCSRNMNWKYDEVAPNLYWRIAKKYELENSLLVNCNYAIQGEIVGPGIQGNKYKLSDIDFYVFNIFDIDHQEYLTPSERYDMCKFLRLQHVPILDFNELEFTDLDSFIAAADGKSLLNADTNREGLVFKAFDQSISFKAISNKFLLKYEE